MTKKKQPRKPQVPLIRKGKLVAVLVSSPTIKDKRFFTSSRKLGAWLRLIQKVSPKNEKMSIRFKEFNLN